MRTRIRSIVLTLLTITIILTMTVASLYGAIEMQKQQQGELSELLQSTGERAALGLASSMWDMDEERANMLLLAEFKERRVHAAVLRDTNQEILSGKLRTPQGNIENTNTSASLADAGYLSKTFNVVFDGELIGTLQLQITQEYMQQTLRDYYVSELLKSLLMTIILITSMSIILGRILIRPLTELTSAANSLSHGNLETRINTHKIGEIGELAKALEVFKKQASEKIIIEEEQEQERLILKQREKDNQRVKEERMEAENRLHQEKLNASEREREQAQILQGRADALLKVVDAVANGDLSCNVKLEGDDAIGRIAQRVDQLVTHLRNSLHGIANSANSLSEASRTLSSTSQNISTTTQQTSVQVVKVSKAAEQISADVKTVADAATHMSATVSGISLNTDQATAVATKANQITNETNAIVKQLAESSAGIGGVIKTITSIAEQTNLLALNATIEAARAGDAGKGFAVVANEVKELAKETATATEEISKRITAIQNDSISVTGSISSVSDIIEQINQLQITVASAVGEQTIATQEISRTVTETARGSHEISVNISAVAAAAEKTSVDAKKAQSASIDLEAMAENLRTLVAQFNLGDTNVLARKAA